MTTSLPTPQTPYQPQPRFDLLHAPLVGRVLRWRWGRLLFQAPLFLLLALIVYDGLTGPQLAPENIATVSAWIHYRGLVILALLFFGNLFCMSCPFTLPRTLAVRLSDRGRRWPRVLRQKWLAIALLFLLFFLYEWLDLWASPWLTAWLAVGYFVGAFVLEALFAESPFCKYLCPLGSFNFVASTASPFQITTRSQDICRTCVGKECVNGSKSVLGCGTELFVPQVQSNLDCVFCLDCARACPHDNVALAARPILHELRSDVWPHRWDVGFLIVLWAAASLSNAFGMTPPVYQLQAGLAIALPFLTGGLGLLLIFGVLNLLLPGSLTLVASWLSRSFAGRNESLRASFSRFIPALIPLGFGMWLAHYGFHFATGALTIIPVLQNFALDHGVRLLGATPNWMLGPILPSRWLLPLEMVFMLVGLAAGLFILNERSRPLQLSDGRYLAALLPWVALLVLFTLTGVYLLTLPMEMRGTVGFGH
ncbi:MAG: hypothetical protein J5I90_22910 [Caldilineales bacterium]|nr:hypothetical protein [Caldilineales bacterium]